MMVMLIRYGISCCRHFKHTVYSFIIDSVGSSSMQMVWMQNLYGGAIFTGALVEMERR